MAHISGTIQEGIGTDMSSETQARGGQQPNRMRGQNRNGAGGGKHRQRHQASQLIDGLEGLDIDLVESLAPTDANSQLNSSGRNRHSTNSRKINLTHLVNYRYDRKHPGGRSRNSPSFGESGNNVQRGSYYRDPGTVHKFSKQQFLQANCQFVVLDGHDYTIHRVDPDWPVDWDCIEEVKFRQIASTETTCPVCLEPPVAAKITRCGHIYCWTCMLHYLSLSDENCRQCPICFEPVYRSDLRSVVSESYANHAVDEEIVMKLMVRKKGCVEVEPYWREYLNPTGLQTPDSKEHYCSQANLVIVDPLTVIRKVADREKDELTFKLETHRNEPEVCFIEQAMDRLNKRIERLQKISTGEIEMKTKQPQTNPIQSSSSLGETSKSYLFYQSSDGQHIYLNPFSTKILCHQYGSLEGCPLEIRAKVLQMDWVSMSDAWRKRFKYLEHLPLTCEFRLIEIDFDRLELVSQATYESYREQINSRAKERERRAREERKREKIIQVEQNRRIYGIQPSLKINLNNIEQFPSVSDERYLGLTKPRNQERDGTDESSASDNEEHPAEVEGQSEQQTTEEQQPQGDVVNVALSFRDIQLQEAMLESKSNAKSQPSGWGAKRPGKTAASSSSFAKLLVDAKSSQKEWTKGATSTTTNNGNRLPASSGAGVPNSMSSSQRHGTQSICSEDTDGAGEELRAPTFEFSIGDFIDANVVSGRRAKAKLKNNKK